MSSLRNQLRPKHQVLILKCYPKLQKNNAAVEVRPNSSELSYLLYYASTRRSKIQKVGAFLERKTDADVRRARTANVQVTLAILTALIDRTRRDLTLYAPYVLRILRAVLASRKLALVEDSVPVFQAFCEHQDVATFAADQALIRLYSDVVATYASFAHKSSDGAGPGGGPGAGKAGGSKAPMSRPISIRWRTAGLTAIESIAKSEAITIDSSLQLATIVPVLLENLHYASEEKLLALYGKLEGDDEAAAAKSERDPARGRPSMATMRTETSQTAQTTTDGTTEDADRIAEEEVGILALRTIRQIFSSNNRGQVRLATQSTLRFILTVVTPAGIDRRPGTAKTSNTTASMLVGNWSTATVQMLARWTPVQDRFVIMVTLMEELVKSPIAEENLAPQLVLAILVDSLLGSSINMIGLSVMDVLLGLVQHILLLLQLGGRGSSILPHHQQTDAIDLFGEVGDDGDNAKKRISKDLNEPLAAVVDDARDAELPSVLRQRLLDRLRICMGALANHIYYSDQIADMIAAILLRLKPSPLSSVPSPVVAVENPEAAAKAISESVKMQEDPKTDAFFSFGTARVTALNAIKEVLVVANNRRASVAGAGAVGRNRVPVQTWEGTQWLLRDEDRRVRRAYVDALTTWLRFEMSKHDLSVMEDRQSRRTKVSRANGGGAGGAGGSGIDDPPPARALSAASRRSGASRQQQQQQPRRSTFLQLLHLAIYDNAVDTPEAESEILLLHLLLYHLVDKLGVNAVQHGLPMIARLQEDINALDAIGTPKAKIVVGSLVHGYLWTLLDRFDFATTPVGHEISAEIRRRRQSAMWLQGVDVAPVPLDKILIAGSANAIRYLDPAVARDGVLRPFDSLRDLVNQIAIAYDDSFLVSPPNSPPASPANGGGRAASVVVPAGPVLAATNTARARQLPEPIRDAMLARWTKASCLASIESATTRSASLHGSQRGTMRSVKNGYLNVDTGASGARGTTPRDGSPASTDNNNLHSLGLGGGGSRRSLRRGIASGAGMGPVVIAAPGVGLQLVSSAESHPRTSSAAGSDTNLSGASGGGVVRFGELKRMLADGGSGGADSGSVAAGSHAAAAKHPLRNSVSVDSDSMVDAEGLSDSDGEEGGEDAAAATKSSATAAAATTTTATTAATANRSRRPSSQSRGGGSGQAATTSPTTTSGLPSSSAASLSSPTTPTARYHHLQQRTRSSSTASAEDPEANARALKGEIVPSVVPPSGGLANSEDPTSPHAHSHHHDGHDPDAVPPVPPLPEGLIGNKASVVSPVVAAAAAVKSPRLPSLTGIGGGISSSIATSDFGAGPGPTSAPSPAIQQRLQQQQQPDKRVSNAARILSGIDVGGGEDDDEDEGHDD